MKLTVFTTKTEHRVCNVTSFTVTPLFLGSGVRHAGGGHVQDARHWVDKNRLSVRIVH